MLLHNVSLYQSASKQFTEESSFLLCATDREMETKTSRLSGTPH